MSSIKCCLSNKNKHILSYYVNFCVPTCIYVCYTNLKLDPVQSLKKGEKKNPTNPFTKVSDVPPDFTAVKFFASLMRTSNMPPAGRWESPFFPFLKPLFPKHRTKLQNYNQNLRIHCKTELEMQFVLARFLKVIYCNGPKAFLIKAGAEKSLHIW